MAGLYKCGMVLTVVVCRVHLSDEMNRHEVAAL
jgi:hypothetical protein